MKIIDSLLTFGRYLASKKRTMPIKMIVVHSTAGGSFSGAWETLKERNLGYHAIVLEESHKDHGHLVKCVPDSRVCGHAGNSYGPLEEAKGITKLQNNRAEFVANTSVNGYSLGISFVNKNDGADTYSKEQHQACVVRCIQWCLAYPSIEWITTHYDVSPKRKTDPKGYNMEKLVEDVNDILKGRRDPVKLWRAKK